jgi:RNA recognition motif-containing protein
MKLFVIGFSQATRLSELADVFEECGEVLEVKMRQGEKNKYALVIMHDGDGERAIEQLNGQSLRGHRLAVEESKW